MNGLDTRLVGSAQLVDLDKKREQAAREAEKAFQGEDESVRKGLAGRVWRGWERNRWNKQKINKRLLYCLRSRKGEYSDAERAEIAIAGGADPVYLKLTGTKCRAASAWIRDIVLPSRGQPFGVEHTPIPEIPPELLKNTVISIGKEIQGMIQGGLQLSTEDQIHFAKMVKEKIHKQIELHAGNAAKVAERKILDMMAEGDWQRAMEEFIEDFVTYPFACMKGPYYKNKRTITWSKGKPVATTEQVLAWRRVSPFDIYPSPYARTSQEDDLIERLRFSREQLYELMGAEGYKEEAIRNVLENYDHGSLSGWLWEEYERDQLETGSSYLNTETNTIDGLHFWGKVEGQDLIDWGYPSEKIKDPLSQYSIEAILIGRHVIRAAVNPSPIGERPYHIACWDEIPGALIGIGLPEQMEDNQKIVNATTRALVTNLSIASGPQTAILTDRLAEGEEITTAYPLKVWQFKSQITGGTEKPIDWFQPPINSVELLNVLNAFEQKADDVTNVPKYSYGNEKIGGAGSTATGLSMLMNAAAKGIRRAIGNIDLDVIRPSVYQTFVELMINDPDPNLYGDVKIVPQGMAALLIKEQQLNSQKEFLSLTTNEFDMQILGRKGRARLLKNIAEELNLDPLMLPSDEDLMKEEMEEKAMAQAQQEAEIQAQQAQAQVAVQQGQEQAGQVDPQQEAMLREQEAGIQKAYKEIEQASGDLQKQMASVDEQAQEVQQAQAQVEQAQAQVQMTDKQLKDQLRKAEQTNRALEQRMKQVEQESNKLTQLEKQIEDSISKLAKERIQNDLKTAQEEAEIERAKIDLETTAKEIQSLVKQLKMVKAEKKKEASEEKDTKAKENVEKISPQIETAMKEALEKVAESFRVAKKHTVQRDDKGKISGIVSQPMEGKGLEAE